MEKLKFGIVGCGRIGSRHAIHANNFGELVGVCDIIPQRATDMAEQYNCNSYTNIDDLLATETDVDVIAICTPNGLHATHTIKSLKAGYHVLCEKPMAIKSQDCVDMIMAAEASNHRLFIVKQNRYNPPIAAVKDVLVEGRLGKILSVQLNCFWNRGAAYFENSWKGTADMDGGILFTQFSHFIDLLYWMFGDIDEVRCMTQNVIHEGVTEFEDQGVAMVQFLSGVLGSVHFTINSFTKNMEGSLVIFGEKGTIKIGGQYLNELEYQSIQDYVIEGLPEGNPANNYGTYQGSMSNHDKVYDNVVNVLLHGGVIGTNGLEGMKTVEIIEKLYRAAKNG